MTVLTDGAKGEGDSAPATYGRSAAGSALWVGFSQLLKILGLLLSVPIVARILSPSDFGVVAMAAPITAFLIFFQDLGLSQSVIQAREVSADQKTGLFWINMLVSASVAVLLILVAPLAGAFYGDPRAGNIIAASALSVLITGLSLMHIALLSRAMRFKALALIELAATATTILSSIGFALMLRNYWAIFLSTLSGVCVQSVLLWYVDSWKPRLRPSIAGTGEMVRFGRGLAGFNLTNFAVRNLDNILIGKFLGSVQLGFYDQSYKLMMAPMQAINGPLSRVTLPVLARLRDQPTRYRRAYVLVVRCLQTILTPGLVVVIAASDRLIPALLGERWAAASPIFQWLCLTGIVQPLGNATGWLFVSSGRTDAMFRWGLVSAVITAIGFIIGLQWGATGVAASLFITLMVRMPFLFIYSSQGTSIRAIDFYRLLVEPMLAGILAYLAAVWLLRHISFWPGLTLALVISYALLGIALLLTRGGRTFVTESWNMLLSIVRKPR